MFERLHLQAPTPAVAEIRRRPSDYILPPGSAIGSPVHISAHCGYQYDCEEDCHRALSDTC